MEAIEVYRSFNSNKSIEELQYNVSRHKTTIENLKFELHFYKFLLSKAIFKPHVINLYERLTKFKNEIMAMNEIGINLINELNSHAHLIRNKIECEDLACDNFFIKNHDDLELKVFSFNTEISNFKFRLFQYMESVINN